MFIQSVQLAKLTQSLKISLIKIGLIGFSLIFYGSAFAKTTEQYATDLVHISEQAKKYFKSNGNWPKSLAILDDEGYLDSLDINDEIKNKDYQIYNSGSRFGVGVISQLIQTNDLDLYLSNLSTFAGYNWLFIEMDTQAEAVPKENHGQAVDYYERQLPFVSNVKQLISGRVFNPQK